MNQSAKATGSPRPMNYTIFVSCLSWNKQNPTRDRSAYSPKNHRKVQKGFKYSEYMCDGGSGWNAGCSSSFW